MSVAELVIDAGHSRVDGVFRRYVGNVVLDPGGLRRICLKIGKRDVFQNISRNRVNTLGRDPIAWERLPLPGRGIGCQWIVDCNESAPRPGGGCRLGEVACALLSRRYGS